NNLTLGSASIDIFGPDWSSGGIIQGQYSIFLQQSASLSQMGLVPLGTKSLNFLAVTNGPFTVSLGGVNLNLISFTVANRSYRLYEADVSAFAGLSAELEFTISRLSPQDPDRSLSLDSIQFSPDTVPEPNSLSLVVVGVACLAFW